MSAIVWQWFPCKYMRINNICLIYAIWFVRRTSHVAVNWHWRLSIDVRDWCEWCWTTGASGVGGSAIVVDASQFVRVLMLFGSEILFAHLPAPSIAHTHLPASTKIKHLHFGRASDGVCVCVCVSLYISHYHTGNMWNREHILNDLFVRQSKNINATCFYSSDQIKELMLNSKQYTQSCRSRI